MTITIKEQLEILGAKIGRLELMRSQGMYIPFKDLIKLKT